MSLDINDTATGNSFCHLPTIWINWSLKKHHREKIQTSLHTLYLSEKKYHREYIPDLPISFYTKSKTYIIFLPDTVIVPDESLNISYWLRNIVAECTYRKYVQNILTSMKNWDVMFQLLETQKMCSYATGSLTWKKLCYLLIRELTSHEIESRIGWQ